MKILFLIGEKRPRVCDAFEQLGEQVITYSEQLSLEICKKFDPEYIISYNYRYIIKPDIIHFYMHQIINLHISYLPWNRGAHPNFWSFWEDTPKGITIHYVDEGIDTGDILAQKEILFEETDTLKSSYEKLQNEIQELLLKNWNDIKNGKIKPKQQSEHGTFHFAKEIEPIFNAKVLPDGWSTLVKEIAKIRVKYNYK